MEVWSYTEPEFLQGLGVVVPAIVALVTSTALSAAYFWYKHPGATLYFMQYIGFHVLGMRLREVTVSGLKVAYAEKGKRKPGSGPSMLFIHGFSASKDMWLPIVALLPRDQHIVLMDLPGHGDTEVPDEDMDINANGMTEFVHKFAEAIELNKEPFHLVGISMGGTVVGLYAAYYPKEVALLTTCCPAMFTPTETEFFRQIREGDPLSCGLLPETTEDMKSMFQLCVYQKHRTPTNSKLLQGMLELRRPRDEFYRRLLILLAKSMDKNFDELMKQVKRIKAPTQLLWGSHDQLIHVTGANLLRDNLPNCKRVDILDRCGHVPSFDRPGAMVKCLLEFRGELSKRRRIPIF